MTMAKKQRIKKFLKTVGTNLHGLRIAKNKDIETVAKAMRITPALLEKIEKGEHDTDLILLLNLCRYYKTSVGDVLPETTSDNK